MKIGLFSGSFNPIHIGHLALMDYLMENTDLEQIWIVPSPCSPFKQEVNMLPLDFRTSLIEEAIKGDSRYRLCNIEAILPKPHYTIRTLSALQMTYPEHTFALLIGADNWTYFDEWYAHDRLLLSYPIYIYPRPNYPLDESSHLLSDSCVLMHEAPSFDISSTKIRKAVMKGKRYAHWIPQADRWEELAEELRKLHQNN